ncbi:glycosyltransferase [Candidatus Dependentiae bacterium]|nr:glycosyltransferase [Candidatus Dependentiae bacterium]
MKILHFITSLKMGGAETALTNFLTYTLQKLPDRTKHTVIYLYDGPHVKKINDLGIPVFQLKGLVHHYDPVAFFRLIRIIKKIKPNVIHTSLWSANIMGRLAGKILGIPVISDLHGSAVDEGNFRNRLDALTAPLAHTIIAVSASVQNAYQFAVIPKIIGEKRRELVTQNICVINNGIDIGRVRDIARQGDKTNTVARSTFGWTEHDFVIGAVGRLEPIKSYDVLIRAFALLLKNKNLNKLPKLCLIGDGSEMHKLKALALTLGVENNIYFASSRSDAIKFYPLFDCFALSSKSEGLSIALLEALCFGLPIVSTHSGIQHDVITHQVNGLLVPIGDEQALAQALLTLINNKKLVDSMHAANLELIKSFDLAQTINAYHKLYR